MIRTLTLAAVLGTALTAQDRDTLFRAKNLIVAPGVEVANGELLVRNGVVVAIGDEITSEARSRAVRVEIKGTILPGMVHPHAYLGQEGDLAERVDAFTPDMRTADAFDPFGRGLGDMARGGVTAIGLAPVSANTFAGITAVVKPGAEFGRSIEDDSYLKMALVTSARSQQRYPTSLMGAADLARQAFAAAKKDLSADNALLPLRDCVGGARTLVIHANTASEIGTALALAKSNGMKPVLLGATKIDDFMASLADAGGSVILPPLGPTSKKEDLERPAKLEKARIAFSFAGTTPAQQRWSAAMALRYGATRRAVLSALTRVPADQLRVADRVGTLRAGHHADFAVFSGDPLNLSSQLEAVYVDGRAIDLEEPSR